VKSNKGKQKAEPQRWRFCFLLFCLPVNCLPQVCHLEHPGLNSTICNICSVIAFVGKKY